jgi:hypothetical protein
MKEHDFFNFLLAFDVKIEEHSIDFFANVFRDVGIQTRRDSVAVWRASNSASHLLRTFRTEATTRRKSVVEVAKKKLEQDHVSPRSEPDILISFYFTTVFFYNWHLNINT